MWLPRLMRAANEEQEHRAAVLHSQYSTVGADILCECGHLTSAARTSAVSPLVCARSTSIVLKHRFALLKWCCIAFLMLSIALIAFSSLLNSSSPKLSSGSSYLFFFISLISLIVFVGPCCLKIRSMCHRRNGLRESGQQFYIPRLQYYPFRWPSLLLSPSIYAVHNHNDHHPTNSRLTSFLSRMDDPSARLPSYSDAVKEPVFAPPPYSFIMQEQSLGATVYESPESSNISGENSGENHSKNMNLESELFMEEISSPVEVSTSAAFVENEAERN